MQFIHRYHIALFFCCVILNVNFVYTFRIMNTLEEKISMYKTSGAITGGNRRRLSPVDPGQLSDPIDNAARAIGFKNGPPIELSNLVDSAGAKLALTKETILYIVKKGDVLTLSSKPLFIPAAPSAPMPEAPSAPAGSSLDQGDTKKSSETETQQSSGSTMTYTVTALPSSTTTGETSTDAKKN